MKRSPIERGGDDAPEIALFCQMTDAETIDAYSYSNPAAHELIDRRVFRASTLRE